MNRENKRKQYKKGYYKTHPCGESFTCRNCGYPVIPAGAGSDHRNHCPNCLCSVHLDIEPGDRESDCGGLMEPVAVWFGKTANGRSSTAAAGAARSAPTGSRRTITPSSSCPSP